jgi:hypothetical protein
VEFLILALPVLVLCVVPFPIAWAKGRRLGAGIGVLGTVAFTAAAIVIFGNLVFRSYWPVWLLALMWISAAGALASLVIGLVSAFRSSVPGSSWERRRSRARPWP